ncbi:MAG: glycosyltransferase family 9 protein [Planctomycetales bacterium]|nr:glycosyltransferase family 9 protein [Planctomycetales bacterium]
MSAVGDCIHTIPVVHALRERFPDCFLAWATHNGPATLLEGLDGINEIVRVPRDWMKSPRSWLNVRRELRKLQFDVAIDPQSLTKSALLGWLSGARYRIGFARPQGRELSLLTNRLLVEPQRQHVVDRYLELLRPLRIDNPNVRFDMPVSVEPNIDAFLRPNDLRTGAFAIINPGAGWPSKIWPSDRYGIVAAHLGEQHGLPSIVTWAGADERQMASKICDASRSHAILASDTSLTELRELVRSAAIFVGSDTGPMHLAVAVGTPCVSIYGPTAPERCGPYGSGHCALHVPVATNNKIRSDDNSAMLQISAADVCAATDQVINRIRQSAA